MIALSRYLFFLAITFTIVYIPIGYSFFSFSEPKTYFLHIFVVLCIVILLIHKFILGNVNLFDNDYFNGSLLEIVRNPIKLFGLISILLVFGIICSTILSPIPYLSFFGASYSRTGYSGYDLLAVIMIMVIVPHLFNNLKSIRSLYLLLITLSLITCVYGMAEIFGFSPIEFKENTDRVHSTFGNTINFSSFIAMMVPVTLSAILFSKLSRWYGVILIGIIIGIELSMLWITATRGPWVGLLVSMAVFSIVLYRTKIFTKNHVFRFIPTLVIAAIVVIMFSILSGSKANEIPTYRLARSVTELTNMERTDNLTDISGGMTGRYQIWKGVIRLITSWDTPRTETNVIKALRPIFGVGPDLFVYSFHFVIEPQSKLTNVENAHNYYLNFLIELGFFNLFILIALLSYIVVVGIKFLEKTRLLPSKDISMTIILIGIFSALIGKFVEMIAGVPRIEDLTILFLLIGLLFSIYKITYGRDFEIVEPQTAKVKQISHAIPPQTLSVKKIVNLILMILITFGLFSIIVHWDARRVYASRLAAMAQKSSDPYDKFHFMKKASEMAPEHEKIVIKHAQAISMRAEIEAENQNFEEGILWAEMAREVLMRHEEIDPFEWDVQLALAVISNGLVDMGASEYMNENKNRHLYIANQYPAYPQILGISSVAVAKSGDLLNAELLANDAIKMEPKTKPFANAWYAKGFVMYKLGYTAEAVDALNKAIESEPLSETAAKAHRTLSKIYSERFKAIEKANFHAERSNHVLDAAKWYKVANETGSRDAQFQVGILYHIGEGVDINLEKAKIWYMLAAEQGHIKSKSNLGAIYQIENNFSEAIKWYTFAAEEGEPGAQHNLAEMYDLGIGVEPNNHESMKWYKLSAEQGFSNSQYKLGLAYRHGDGVINDYETALSWFVLAANQGHIGAFFQLGEIYRNGEGVATDIETSEKWFTQWQNIKFPDKKRFRDESQGQPIECPPNAKIILIAGESNAGNHLEKTNVTVPSNFVNAYFGNCFKVSGPALGSTGRNGSITSYIASKLKSPDPIIFVNTAFDNSSVFDWALSHEDSLSNFANSQLKMFDGTNNELAAIVWIQGESDVFSDINYFSHFSKIQKLLTNGINGTPVHYIVTQSSKCDPNGPDVKITDAQALVANNSETVHIAINTDNLSDEYRMDGCHYNGDGANIIAHSIAKKIEDILIR